MPTTTTTPDLVEILRRSRDDIAFFAERVLATPLLPYQLEMARSKPRRRIACCGRQIGKSWWVSIEAIHFAATNPGSNTLIVSAGEVAALRIMEVCSLLIARSPLASSVVNDHKSKIIFSNGAQIESVPASERQIRSASIDLLVIDEAGYVPSSIWRAAEGTTTARPDARFLVTSTPAGTREHWFHLLWRKGMDAPDQLTQSWHFPSSVSPFVTDELLEQRRSEMPSHVFAQEYLAEWADDFGAFFPSELLDASIVDYSMLDPMKATRHMVAGGIDWGMAHDANAVVYVAALGDVEINREQHGDRPVFWIPAIEQHFRMDYSEFIDRLTTHAKHLDVYRFVSESNGVGQMPSQVLRDQLRKEFVDNRSIEQANVRAVATTAQRKVNGFGRIKVLLQQGRLLLPRHPDLLRQLNALTYEQLDSGLVRISVPENIGHDDLAMALMQATSIINPNARARRAEVSGQGELLRSAKGTLIPAQPSASDSTAIFLGGDGKKV